MQYFKNLKIYENRLFSQVKAKKFIFLKILNFVAYTSQIR